MSRQEKIIRVPQLYLNALNNKSVEDILSLYAIDATIEDPVDSEPLIGIDAIRTFYSNVIMFDLEMELTGQIRVTENEAAFPFFCKNIHEGIAIHVIDVFKFNQEGFILSMKAYWGETNTIPL